MKKRGWILCGVSAGVLLAVGGIVDYFFRLAIHRDMKLPGKTGVDSSNPFEERIKAGMDWFRSQETERVFETSYDGLKLAADILPADEADGKRARGVLVLMHGFRGSAAHDFSCAVRLYHEQGFHLICPHQRAHGMSEGKHICYGVKERYDCQMWVEYAVHRYGADLPIVLDGISMGASTVLMATSLPLPANVKGVIADCGFTSPWDIFTAVMYKWFRLKPFPFLYLTSWYSRLRAGFGFKDCDTRECMKENTIPVLFIHGTGDDFVPCWMTEAAYVACHGPKEMVLVEGASHGFSFLTEEERCTKALLDFFGKYVCNS